MRKKPKIIFILVTFGIFLALSAISNYSNIDSQGNNNGIAQIRDETNLKNASPESINITTPVNKTYMNPMSGYYPATYGFENDKVGSFPTGWIKNVGSGCDSEVIEFIGGHNHTIAVYDNNDMASIILGQDFVHQTNGIVELYAMVNDSHQAFDFGLLTWILPVVRVSINNSKLYVYNNFTVEEIIPILNDTWYHFSLRFRCDGASALPYPDNDLGNNNWRLYINGVKYGDYNLSYRLVADVWSFALGSSDEGSNYAAYIDALGYSWDPDYDIGDNLGEGLLLSFDNSTNLDWIGYSLDGQNNITISGNTTIPMPDSGRHTIQVFGNNSIGNTYESNIRRFCINPINIITPENKTYREPMSGYYPATYSFDDQEAGTTGSNIDFIDIDTQNKASIVSEVDGHKSILKLLSSGGVPTMHDIDGDPANGTIEFYVRAAQNNKYGVISISNGLTLDKSIWLRFNNNGNISYNAAGGDHYIQEYSANTWYHFKIKFDCDSAGDGTNDWHLWIDNISMDGGNGYEYWGNPISMKTIIMTIFEGPGSMYYDAFGYSWDDNYEIGDNMNEGLLLGFKNYINLDWIGYSLDGQPNETISGNTTIPMPDYGHHTIQVFGNTTLGMKLQSKVRQFTIDSSEPSVAIISPKMGIYGLSSLLINASITDTLSIISSVKTMINASTPFNISMTQDVGNYWSCIWDNISDYLSGDYKIIIWAIDDGGNVNQTQFIVIRFDKSKPNVGIVSPIAGTYGPPSLLINVSLTDSFSNISSAKAMINAMVPFNISMTPGVGNYWFCQWDNISAYSNGVYTITIWVIDEGGNVNQTQFIVITIYKPPIVDGVGSDGNDGNDSSDSVKDNSEFLYIVIIILVSSFGIIAFFSVVLIKKRSNLLKLPKSKEYQICPICNKKHKEFWILCKECYDKQEKVTISIICPTCKLKKNIKVPKLVVDAAKQLATISVPRGLMCQHHFQAFLDRQFNVRGYQKVDFESISKQ